MNAYYPPYRNSSNNVKVKLDLTNYASKTDLKNITHVDVSSFASKTNLAALKTKVDQIDADKLKTTTADLAKLTNAIENDVVKKTDYNTKVTSIEAQIAGVIKIKAANVIAKSANTKANTIRSNLTAYATKADVATDITAIKNNNVTNANLSSQLNDLKSQHIATEVTGIDNKTKKNASDILALENKLTQKEDTINENERGLSFNRGLFFYTDQSYLKYECKAGSFGFALNSKNISEWKSTGIYNHSSKSSMNVVANTKTDLPNYKNDGRMHVHLNGNHFQQIVAGIPNNNNVINIYCVYKLDPIASTRDSSYTIQDALFGAMQITKNATDYDKNNYKRYGICFDERSQFGHTMSEGGRTHITNGRNVLIFGANMSFSVHATNRANHIYLMGD